jgi:Tol biopolymer transport system component
MTRGPGRPQIPGSEGVQAGALAIAQTGRLPRRMTRRVLLAAALLAAAACSRGPDRRAPAAAAAIAGAPPQWELVYEHDVNGNVDLYVVPAGGGPERRLTEDPGEDGLARWTPDGNKIIFTSNRTGTPQIWEVPAGGGREHRVRSNAATEYQSDPSPDGTQLAFLSNLDGPERLMLQDLRTGAVRELVRHGDHPIMGNPNWSPDGRLITFSSNWRMGHQIYVVEVATGSYRRISGVTTGGCEPRFSRDSKKVVYVSRGHLRPTSRLVEHDLATDEEKPLVSWPALNYDPVYSPDGTELAFASNITGEYAIYSQRLSDGRAWRVSVGHGDARNPDYKPVH